MGGEARGLLLEVSGQFDYTLHVAHEVVRGVDGEGVDVDALEDCAGVLEVVGIGVVVQQREHPAVAVDVVHAGKAAPPLVVLGRGTVEKALPVAPQRLREPVGFDVDAAGGIHTDNAFGGVARAGRGTERATAAFLLTGQAKQTDVNRTYVHAGAGEHVLARVIVEHVICTLIAWTVDREVVGNAITVHRPECQAHRPEAAIEDHAAVVGEAGHAVSHEVLEGQARLAREHQVIHLELAEHGPDLAAEGIVMPEPGVFNQGFAIRALLGEDAVEVIGDVVRKRCAGEQFDEIRCLEIEFGIVVGEASVGAVDLASLPALHE